MKKQADDIVKKLSKKIDKTKEKIKQKEEKQLKKENKKKSKKNKIITKIIEFLEACIYILAIICAIFANLYGNIYMQMIPILFILGIVGKIIFNRPVTTTAFGMIVSICAVYTTGVKSIQQNLILSAIMSAYIAFGEMCAFAMQKSYSYILKKKKRVCKKAIVSYVLVIVTLVVSLVIYNYTNSNIFELQKAKRRLNEYLLKGYSNMNFEITNVKYNFLGEKSFEFCIKNIEDGKLYNFIVSKDEKYDIDDGYEKYIKVNKEKNINENLIKYIKDNNLYEKYEDIKIKIELNEIDNLELAIEKTYEKAEGSITDEEILEASKKIAMVINDLAKFEYFKNVEQIVIILKNKNNPSQNITSYLNIDRYINNESINIEKDYEYIKDALNVEYID